MILKYTKMKLLLQRYDSNIYKVDYKLKQTMS